MKIESTIPSFNFDQDGTLSQWRWVPVEQVRHEGYFRNVLPQVEVIKASKLLAALGFMTRTYGACWLDDGHSLNDKNMWMDRHASHIRLEDRIYVQCGTPKPAAFERYYGRKICSQDILIDDFSENLREWEAAGGTAVKVRTPQNGSKGTWNGCSFWCTDDAEAIARYLLSCSQECR